MSVYSVTPDSVHSEAVRDLTRLGRRSTVGLVRRHDGTLAVQKTFHLGCERFFEREVAALRELRKIDVWDVIPPLLAVETRSFVVPYYEDILTRRTLACTLRIRLMPVWAVHAIFQAVKQFHRHGYVFLDFVPHNVVVDKCLGVKLIDFEFTYRDPSVATVPFHVSPTIVGLNDNCDRDIPVGHVVGKERYKRIWRPYTGLPLQWAAGDSKVLKYMGRMCYSPWEYAWRGARRVCRRFLPPHLDDRQ